MFTAAGNDNENDREVGVSNVELFLRQLNDPYVVTTPMYPYERHELTNLDKSTLVFDKFCSFLNKAFKISLNS